MSVVDTHCHLEMVGEAGIDPRQALLNARNHGVEKIIQIAVDLKSAQNIQSFVDSIHAENSADYPDLYWTAGLHPESARENDDIDDLLVFIRNHYQHTHFVGIGELGLDYYQNPELRDVQQDRFIKQLDLALELNLPVVLHLRDDRVYNPDKMEAYRDALKIIRDRGVTRGVLHCYTYGFEEAMPFVEMGWMVSYSGIVTYKNAVVVQDGAFRLPLSALMVETDAPFLAPAPHRGKTNEPAYVVHTLDFIAQKRSESSGQSPETIKSQILSNSNKFIGWKNHA